MPTLSPGDTAPDFTLKNQHGDTVSLSQYQGQPLVVYFYPKDDTPGCTAEACAFRDQYEAFKDAGAEVIGISADSVDSHQRFAQERRLSFHLLSDPNRQTAKAYGIKSSLFGLVPGRETFVIDAQGKVRHHFSSQFNIQGHIREALEVIQELKAKG